MPILTGEAEETERVVLSLSPMLRRAIEVWYLQVSSMNEKRRVLRCRRERVLELVEEARRAIVHRLYCRQRTRL